jgi:hypothetical protein
MTVTIDIGIAYLPEYILTEAEFLAQKLCELFPVLDNLCLTIGRRDFMYLAGFKMDLPGRRLSSNAASRYPDDAIECSFWRLLASAKLFIPRRIENENNMPKNSRQTFSIQPNRICLKQQS